MRSLMTAAAVGFGAAALTYKLLRSGGEPGQGRRRSSPSQAETQTTET